MCRIVMGNVSGFFASNILGKMTMLHRLVAEPEVLLGKDETPAGNSSVSIAAIAQLDGVGPT